MSLAATVRAMADAGCSIEQIVAVVEAHESGQADAIEARRSNDRERKKRQRSRDVTGSHVMSRESRDTPSPKESSPTPPKEITPSPISPSLRSGVSAEPPADGFEPDQTRIKRQRADDGPLLDELAEMWNAEARSLGLPQVQGLTAKRIAHLRARIREMPVYGFDDPRTGFATALGRIRGSPFMLGENGRGWRANFDHLISQEGFTKLLEGFYAQGRSGSGAGCERH